MTKIDEVIPFRAGVNCTFFGKVLSLAGRQFGASNKGLTVARARGGAESDGTDRGGDGGQGGVGTGSPG